MKRSSESRPRQLDRLAREIVACEACPRLREYCRLVACEKVRRFARETYWARPVPGFGDPDAEVLLLGLAPAAHGGNRTGRVFTGDRSGEFLFAALHRAGLANQPVSQNRQDGLELRGAWVAPLVRCAPPGNRPFSEEIERCRGYLARELDLLVRVRAIVALGAVAWNGLREVLAERIGSVAWKQFAHGVELTAGPYQVWGAYHPSQQNTFTRRVTAPMYDELLLRVRAFLVKEAASAVRGRSCSDLP